MQEGEHIPIENKFTKDYVREKAVIYSKNLEEQRKMIKYRGEKRSEIHDYWNMNNKLIENMNNNKTRPPRDIKNSNDRIKKVEKQKNFENNLQKEKNNKQNDFITLGEAEGEIELIYQIRNMQYMAQWQGRLKKADGT